MRGMTLEQHLTRLGGVATRRTLVQLTSRREVERALGAGRIVRNGHGRYALPFIAEAIQVANALAGVASHRSAAGHWGWAMKASPDVPSVTVPRKRRVDPLGIVVRSRAICCAVHRSFSGLDLI